MKRSIIAIILIISLLGLCSCSKAADKNVEETTTVAVQETESPTEAPKSETVQPEAEAESIVEADEKIIPELSLIHLAQTTVNKGMNVGTNNEGNAYVYYPAFMLLDEDAQKFPKLNESLLKLNESYDSEYSEHLTDSHELGESALADGTDMQISFYDRLTPEIRRADSHILSIFENYDSYTGGVHGYYAFLGDNLDPQTGDELLLDDVVADKEAFTATVKEKLFAQYPAEQFDDLDTALADMFNTENGAMPWTMDYSGITLYFNPYHIAAYAAGMQVITIPFNENPDIFVQDYLDVPDVYAQQLNSQAPAIVDANGDGMNEAVFVTSEDTEPDYDGDGYTSGYQTWTIYCGDKEISIEDYCYRGDFYLVRANGQYYVYVLEVSDNDYSVCSVVDLRTMTNKKEKNFNACLTGLGSNYEYTDGGYESISSQYVFTDPDALMLSTRMDVMGTNSGSKIYRAGNDGWPVSDDPYYSVESAMVYTAKQDVSCKEVDEDGAEKADATLQAGKHYVMVRTDNKSWADIQEVKEGEYTEEADYPYVYLNEVSGLRTDRPIYRLPYKQGSWPHTINGIGEEELFDGILYAG